MEIRVAYYKWPTHISSKLFNVKTNTHLNSSYLRDITGPGEKLSPNKRKPIIWSMLTSCASEYLNHKTAISFQRSSFLNVFKHAAIIILWFKMFALSYVIQYRKSRQWQQIAVKPIREIVNGKQHSHDEQHLLINRPYLPTYFAKLHWATIKIPVLLYPQMKLWEIDIS